MMGKQELKKLQAAYSIELLFEKEGPAVDMDRLCAALTNEIGETELVEDEKKYQVFLLRGWKQTSGEGKKTVPGLSISRAYLDFSNSEIEDLERFQYRYQAIAVKKPDAILKRCTKKLLLGDSMAASLPYAERCALLDKWLRLALKEFPACVAVRFPASGRLLTPEECMEESGQPELRFLNGGVSFRLFQVADGKPARFVADSLGLYAIGLPDVQCHFKGLKGSAVAEKMMDLAAYQFLKGDVIKNDEAVPGIEKGDWWGCQHERSMLPPYREVLDVTPGDHTGRR